MILKKFELEDIIYQKEKRIICYTMVTDYLRQIDSKFHILNRITMIVDELQYRYGQCEIGDLNFSVPVVGIEELKKIDWNCYILLITSEYYWKKYEKIKELKIVPASVGIVYYFEDTDTAYYQQYLNFYRCVPLKNEIVFRSGERNPKDFPYMDFADNAKAMFDHMLDRGYHTRYKITWIVGDHTKYEDYKKIENVEFINADWCCTDDQKKRDRYYASICLARYFFFTNYGRFIRFPRRNQIRVQLWHGHGFKARTLKDDCSFQYEYMPVAGQFYKEIHREIFHLNEEQLFVAGLPKHDWIYHPISAKQWCDLNLPERGRFVFWLPTFRNTGKKNFKDDNTLHTETGLPIVDNFEKMYTLERKLRKMGITLIIKQHPIQCGMPMPTNYSNIVYLDNELLMKQRLNINQMLGYADALISDYSSVAMDYTLLDRPIAFAVSDMEKYRKSRGFILPDIRELLPGKELYTFDEFLDFIEDVAEHRDTTREKRRHIRWKMSIFDDDHNCERILKYLGLK